jgi:hypothetical protein
LTLAFGAPDSAHEAEVVVDVCCCWSPVGAEVLVGVLVSAFNDGKLAGGRRAEGTFPKLCIPCLRGTAFFCVAGSDVSP